jgi:hypothetical protein
VNSPSPLLLPFDLHSHSSHQVLVPIIVMAMAS